MAGTLMAGCADTEDEDDGAAALPRNLVTHVQNDGAYDALYWPNVSSPSENPLLAESGAIRRGESATHTLTLTAPGTHEAEHAVRASGLTGGGFSGGGSFGFRPEECSRGTEILAEVTIRSDGTVLGPTGGGAGASLEC